MKIEVNKRYIIEPTYKKSFTERWFYKKDGVTVTAERGWRFGSVVIAPQDEDEVEVLQYAYDNENPISVTSFEEWELIESWDECWYDVDSSDSDAFDAQEELEKYWDDEELTDEYFSFEDYLEYGLDFDNVDYELDIDCAIDVKLDDQETV